MSAMISHDPFAREELHRSSIAAGERTCSWCGQTRVNKKTGNKFLFQYSIVKDGVIQRENKIPGLFCSVDCMRTYHS